MDLEQYTLEEIEAFMQTEEYEQLDELSKKTLGLYVKKATGQVKSLSNMSGYRSARSSEMDKTGNPKSSGVYATLADRDSRKAESRQRGINKAVDRLTKEGLDESVSVGDKVVVQTVKGEKEGVVHNITNTHVGVRHPGIKGVIHYHPEYVKKKIAEEYTEPCFALIQAIEESKASDITAIFDKIMAQKLSEVIEDKKVEITESIFVSQEDQELMEDYEQLDELSKQTLGRYVLRNHEKSASLAREKADNDDAQSKAMSLDYGSNREASKHMKPVRDALHDAGKKIQHKISNRQLGMYRAVSRLTKEQVEEFLQSEEFQALDELSKQTLGSYIKKSATGLSGAPSLAYQAGLSSDKDTSRKLFAKSVKRAKGLEKAASRLTKE